nr:reverse transcriptase domain-containing protein [Tanacetum cinerariifolium]
MANISEDIQCGKENGVNILKSIDEGPFQMGTVRVPLAEGTEGAPHLGLPRDICTLINHYTDAKDIWDNVKMLLEGSELTKEDQESQLYDDFEHFRQHKGETIHDYYVRFAKLVNDMRNIKMTMFRMQLNSKFVNNMLPQWGRFMTANFIKYKDQATVQDGRVVVQNVLGQQNRGQGTNPWGGGAAGYGGVQNRVGNANPGQARLVKCYNCNGIKHIARNYTQPKRPKNFDYFKDKMLLMQAQENGMALDEEHILFLASRQANAIDKDVDEQPVQDIALNVDNVFQADDCDAFDSDADEAPMAQTMFMANLSSTDHVYDEAGPSYDSNILSEVYKEMYDAYMMIYNDMYEPHAQSVPKTSQNTVVDNSLTTELATYKEQVELYERWARTVGENCTSWSDKLEDALWAFRTAFKTSIGCTPYRLVYGKACYLPLKFEHKAYWALKHANFDLKTAGDHQKLQLNELNELRDQAYENSLIYKEQTKKLHDDKIKNRIFNVGDQVLLFNSRLKIFSGKLKSRWFRPFTISEIYPYGTAKLIYPDDCNFKVNCHRLKHYHGGDPPPLEI